MGKSELVKKGSFKSVESAGHDARGKCTSLSFGMFETFSPQNNEYDGCSHFILRTHACSKNCLSYRRSHVVVSGWYQRVINKFNSNKKLKTFKKKSLQELSKKPT